MVSRAAALNLILLLVDSILLVLVSFLLDFECLESRSVILSVNFLVVVVRLRRDEEELESSLLST